MSAKTPLYPRFGSPDNCSANFLEINVTDHLPSFQINDKDKMHLQQKSIKRVITFFNDDEFITDSGAHISVQHSNKEKDTVKIPSQITLSDNSLQPPHKRTKF